MTEFIEKLPNARFGSESSPLPDWRKAEPKENDEDDDEAFEDAPASDDLIAMLGFDPDKEDFGEGKKNDESKSKK